MMKVIHRDAKPGGIRQLDVGLWELEAPSPLDCRPQEPCEVVISRRPTLESIEHVGRDFGRERVLCGFRLRRDIVMVEILAYGQQSQARERRVEGEIPTDSLAGVVPGVAQGIRRQD